MTSCEREGGKVVDDAVDVKVDVADVVSVVVHPSSALAPVLVLVLEFGFDRPVMAVTVHQQY